MRISEDPDVSIDADVDQLDQRLINLSRRAVFTTKPGGSGIGLVLSRQIAEAGRHHRPAVTLPEGYDIMRAIIRRRDATVSEVPYQ